MTFKANGRLIVQASEKKKITQNEPKNSGVHEQASRVQLFTQRKGRRIKP